MVVVIKAPGEAPAMTNLKNDLAILQDVVGGFIEVVPYRKDIVMIINEEGKLSQLRDNFSSMGDTIVGNAIFCRTDGEDFTDLVMDDVKDLYEYFTILELTGGC